MESDARPDLRYEVKLVGDTALMGEVRAAFVLDPAGVRTLFPPRTVQSLYLDTFEDDAFEENLAGVSLRSKLRFRWYGDGAALVSGKLERKVRENSLGWKELADPGCKLHVEGRRKDAFLAELRSALAPAWQVRLDGQEITQWIRYRREYFTTFDGRVRVTVDTSLAAKDLRPHTHLTAVGSDAFPRALVVECKAAPEHEGALRELVERLPLVVDKCSKFVMASSRAESPLASVLPF